MPIWTAFRFYKPLNFAIPDCMKILSGIFFVFLILCDLSAFAQAPSPLSSSKCIEFQYIKSNNSEKKLNRYGIPRVNNDELKSTVSNGRTMYYPTDFNDLSTIADLLNLENDARIAERGCWATGFQVYPASKRLKTDQFMIVEGRVLNVHETYDNTYLNFGDDWKTDFTVRIQNKNPFFKEYDAQTLKNKHVRVRGFVENYNGPSMTIEHPILIEALPPVMPAP